MCQTATKAAIAPSSRRLTCIESRQRGQVLQIHFRGPRCYGHAWVQDSGLQTPCPGCPSAACDALGGRFLNIDPQGLEMVPEGTFAVGPICRLAHRHMEAILAGRTNKQNKEVQSSHGASQEIEHVAMVSGAGVRHATVTAQNQKEKQSVKTNSSEIQSADVERVPQGIFHGGERVPRGTFHGGERVPRGTFHGGERVPRGTFHGGERVPQGTFH